MDDMVGLLWSQLGWPLIRLTFFISLGILVGNFIEALNWTSRMAKLSAPLIRAGNLSDVSGASFSLSFFSGVSGNTMLAEAYDQKRITKTELVLGNLFNSLPAYFLHLPTMFFITVPLIRGAAVVYVGLTLLAAFLRTFLVLFIGRFVLPKRDRVCIDCEIRRGEKISAESAWRKTLSRFKLRILRVMMFTVPIYTSFVILKQFAFFAWLEGLIASHLSFLTWLHPESLGVIVFQVVAEFTAGLAAAGVLLESGTMNGREIILALLVGNILSSPVRGIRHQFPVYAGIFTPKLALELIFYSQAFRVGSMILVASGYYFLG
ncbi:MAG: hypothetical protein KKG47_03210 [Proteobacteria bacterium]|nr:hypothetical protein [Pseudomonadota bacterium]MBU1738903.1 hypothetical protein [Pseudomonadota bacterium]